MKKNNFKKNLTITTSNTIPDEILMDSFSDDKEDNIFIAETNENTQTTSNFISKKDNSMNYILNNDNNSLDVKENSLKEENIFLNPNNVENQINNSDISKSSNNKINTIDTITITNCDKCLDEAKPKIQNKCQSNNKCQNSNKNLESEIENLKYEIQIVFNTKFNILFEEIAKIENKLNDMEEIMNRIKPDLLVEKKINLNNISKEKLIDIIQNKKLENYFY